VKKINLEKYKNYILSLKSYILIAILIFVFGIFYGYFTVQTAPHEIETVLEELRKLYEPVFEMSSLGQFLFVLLNNGVALTLIIFSSVIFGFFPFLALLSNGTVLGIVAFFSQQNFSWSVFFLGTLPHGIIELPVLILAGAIGLKIGQTVFQRVMKKEVSIKKELSAALEFFWKILLPFLALAAAIEIFITANLLGV